MPIKISIEKTMLLEMKEIKLEVKYLFDKIDALTKKWGAYLK